MKIYDEVLAKSLNKYFLHICVLFFFCPVSVSLAKADSELICNFDKYNTAGGAKIEIIKSFIPEAQRHLIKDNKETMHLDFGLEGEVTKDTDKRLEFRYEFVNRGTTNVSIRYIYFRTNDKTNVTMKPQGYQDIGPIWGKCREIKNTSNQYIRYTDASEKDVCGEVAIVLGEEGMSLGVTINNEDGTVQNQGWIDEAKRRWGADYISHCASVLRPTLNSGSSTSSIPTTSTSSSKLDKAKSTCTELGFTLGTEKHGDCVLKMMDN